MYKERKKVKRRENESRSMKDIRRVIAGVLCCMAGLSFWGANTGTAAAAGNDRANRMNVVFVLDESGSMSGTDSSKLRYEAVDLFLGIATDTGNYMGAVAFNDMIVQKEDIREITGKGSKNILSDSIRRAQSHGDTDIGKAIELATQMLEQGSDNGLSSAIILLSDGNTDLPEDITGKAMEASAISKENAIASARKNGVKIHTICLNANGQAKKEELQEISDATGGICVEVKSAEDLKDVFRQFYGMIYSTDTIKLADTVIPVDGELEIPFEIPMIGVEEANIIINTLNADTSYNLSNPSGYGYTQAEMKDMEIKARTFTIIKIQNPEAGNWKLLVRGVAGDQVTIDMVYNSDLTLEMESNVSGSIPLGGDVEFTARLFNNGMAVTDEEVYKNYSFYLTVKDTRTGNSEEKEMEAGGDCARYIMQPGQYGDLEFQACCGIDSMLVKSDVIFLSIGNTPPAATGNPIIISRLITPFSEDLYTVDLNQYVTDAEDTELSYSISFSEFDDKVVSVDHSELNIRIKECGKGVLTVTAMDSGGESIEVDVHIKIQNIFPIIGVIMILIILIIVMLIFIIRMKKNNGMIRGRIQIAGFNEDGFVCAPETFDGNKGKMALSRYVYFKEDVGINLARTYLMAGEKASYIYLVSPTGYYTDFAPTDRNKKIRIEAEMEMNISSDIDFEKGIRIVYIPNEINY